MYILQTLQLEDNSIQGGSKEDLCVTNLKVFFILLAFENVEWKLQCWVHLSGDCGELHEWSQLLSGVCWSSCCHLWWTVSQVVFFLYVFFIHVPQDYRWIKMYVNINILLSCFVEILRKHFWQFLTWSPFCLQELWCDASRQIPCLQTHRAWGWGRCLVAVAILWGNAHEVMTMQILKLWSIDCEVTLWKINYTDLPWEV